MRTLYVVAHPEAAHHVSGLVGGWHDSDLTDVGKRHAAAIAQALFAAIPPNAPVSVTTSDLRRAVQTAEPIAARLGVKTILDPRLREKSYGAAEGQPQAWLDERFVPPPAVGDRMRHEEGISGAETKMSLAQRIYAAVKDLLQYDDEHQVIVTHGFALTFVVAAFTRLPIETLGYINFRSHPGSITTLHEDDYFHNRQIVRLSDTRHLN